MKQKNINFGGMHGKRLASSAAALIAALVLGFGVTACEDGGGPFVVTISGITAPAAGKPFDYYAEAAPGCDINGMSYSPISYSSSDHSVFGNNAAPGKRYILSLSLLTGNNRLVL